MERPGNGGAPARLDELERRRAELAAQLVHVRSEMEGRRHAATPGGERPGFGKRAGDYVAQVVEDRTNHQLADSLALTAEAIEAALGRIDQGRYGCCEACGEAIDEGRLEAVPWAPLCLRCQTGAERHRNDPIRRAR